MAEFDSVAVEVLDAARKAGVMVATAESCTGGLIAGQLTEIAGSSDVVDRGFVTYTNAAKMEMLGVRAETLKSVGAVAEQTAREMAAGALARSRAGIAVSVTGVAGPGGGSADKPVGLVWFGLAKSGADVLTLEKRFGDIGRDRVRAATIKTALTLILENL
ncbi:CinA family protein [Maricaulaceae bacterium NA33B04]|nr:CinA family protein [Maricaulaceae bacterium NA33B04]